jgi:hypothetical protein
MTRYFRVPEGRTLVLPQGVQAGPGATSMRLRAGAILVLEHDQAVTNGRFLNGRLRAGDLAELDQAEGAKAAEAQAKELARIEKERAEAKVKNLETDTASPIEHLPKPDPSKPMAMPGSEAERQMAERTARNLPKKEG